MVDVWVVIGEANVHKTSSIRALTGAGRTESKWKIRYHDGDKLTYVHPSGLQEMKKAPEGFIEKVHEAAADRVVVALRNRPARGCPDAATYLSAFRNVGWNIVGQALLGFEVSSEGAGALVPVPDASSTPSNEIAAQLRRAWHIS